ncbi:MAG TPA: HXXEE domain-containing protein [Spirochaetota bacterium]|nr:HXXEE domain-containing protein [Spirochaetota bacterium]HNT11521.1 HXXEE domain-containing protein [Spirochaetota bacterium]
MQNTTVRSRLEKILLLTPVFFAVHNAEEALMMRRADGPVPFFGGYPVSPDQFAVAIVVLTVIGFLVTAAAWRFWGRRYFLLVMNGFLSMFILNAFFPHIIASIVTGTAAPGVATAVLLYLPFGVYGVRSILRHDLLYRRHFIVSLAAGPVVAAALAGLCLLVGYLAVP